MVAGEELGCFAGSFAPDVERSEEQAKTDLSQPAHVPLLTIELRTERGEVRGTAFDAGAFDRVRPSISDSSMCLRFVDPYGNTIFNPMQAEVLASELSAILSEVASHDDRERLGAVIALARQCVASIHTYLWFIGD